MKVLLKGMPIITLAKSQEELSSGTERTCQKGEQKVLVNMRMSEYLHRITGEKGMQVLASCEGVHGRLKVGQVELCENAINSYIFVLLSFFFRKSL
ncbi:hypothetical protein I7I50_08804 [Histoplasma capsulatum G186AR]|uniref:Uncharacterized protein n=1 Tax=Ajellomyces capsulatus TaxID=5037 RepID=A0A8H8CZZ2_AJECA|nr:hypothetical protein I7I52_06318 [Histoplasma capsulatum]QSS73875.1 hypothetical protein I7I50_08804 [Histoplasma capsulatum G186AR]